MLLVAGHPGQQPGEVGDVVGAPAGRASVQGRVDAPADHADRPGGVDDHT